MSSTIICSSIMVCTVYNITRNRCLSVSCLDHESSLQVMLNQTLVDCIQSLKWISGLDTGIFSNVTKSPVWVALLICWKTHFNI